MSCNCDISGVLKYDEAAKTLTIDPSVKLVATYADINTFYGSPKIEGNLEVVPTQSGGGHITSEYATVNNTGNGAFTVQGGGAFNTSKSAENAINVTGSAFVDGTLNVSIIEGLTSINQYKGRDPDGLPCLDVINNGSCGLQMTGMGGENGNISTGDWFSGTNFMTWSTQPKVSILYDSTTTTRNKNYLTVTN